MSEWNEATARLVRLAISDPGAFLARHKLDGYDGTEYESIPNWAMRAVMGALADDPLVLFAQPAPAGLDARPVVRYTLHCSHCGKEHRGEFDSPTTWTTEVLAELHKYLVDGDGWEMDVDAGHPLVCPSCLQVGWCELCDQPVRAWEKFRTVNEGRPAESEEHVDCQVREGEIEHWMARLGDALPTTRPDDEFAAEAALRLHRTRMPVGTPVRYWPGEHEGDGIASATASHVWWVNGELVVRVEGCAERVWLDHIWCVEPAPEERVPEYHHWRHEFDATGPQFTLWSDLPRPNGRRVVAAIERDGAGWRGKVYVVGETAEWWEWCGPKVDADPGTAIRRVHRTLHDKASLAGSPEPWPF